MREGYTQKETKKEEKRKKSWSESDLIQRKTQRICCLGSKFGLNLNPWWNQRQIINCKFLGIAMQTNETLSENFSFDFLTICPRSLVVHFYIYTRLIRLDKTLFDIR